MRDGAGLERIGTMLRRLTALVRGRWSGTTRARVRRMEGRCRQAGWPYDVIATAITREAWSLVREGAAPASLDDPVTAVQRLVAALYAVLHRSGALHELAVATGEADLPSTLWSRLRVCALLPPGPPPERHSVRGVEEVAALLADGLLDRLADAPAMPAGLVVAG